MDLKVIEVLLEAEREDAIRETYEKFMDLLFPGAPTQGPASPSFYAISALSNSRRVAHNMGYHKGFNEGFEFAGRKRL